MNLKLAAVVILGVSIISAGSPAGGELVDSAAMTQAGLTQYWDARLPLPSGDRVKEAFLVDDSLYVTTVEGMLFSVQADVGLIRWAEKLAPPDCPIGRPAHALGLDGKGPVIVPVAEKIKILDRFTGREVREIAPRFSRSSAAVGFGKLMFLGGSDGHVHAIIWDVPEGVVPLEHWVVDAGGVVAATPLLYGAGKLAFATVSGRVYSCFALDKAFDWAFTAGGSITSEPVADDRGVYVASLDRSLYKLDSDTGRLVWRVRMSSPLSIAPVLASQVAYQFCSGEGVVAVDANTGSVKWRNGAAVSFVADSGGSVVLSAADGALLVVGRDGGKLTGTVATYGVADIVANAQGDSVIVLGSDGYILCARPEGVPYLHPERVSAEKARLNVPPRDADDVEGEWAPSTAPNVDPLDDDPLRSRRDLEGR